MNEDQLNIIEEYIEIYGGGVLEYNGTVQLKLNPSVIISDGLDFEWINKFQEHFIGGKLCSSPNGEVYINLHLLEK